MHARRVWLIAVALGAVGALGCGDEPESLRLPDLSGVGPEGWTDVPGRVIEPSNIYGTLDGPAAFGLIIDVAARSDGAIAVADLFACSVVVLERPSGRVLDRFGRCGGGPGEFRQIRSIASWGDSLFVYDQGRNIIAVLDSAGVEVSAIQVGAVQGMGSGIAHLEVLDDSTAVVALEGVQDASVGLLDLRKGEIRGTLVGEPRRANDGPGTSIRRMAACLHNAEPGPLAVVMSNWLFEGVGINVDDRSETFHFMTSVPMTPRRLDDGTWLSGNGGIMVACAESGALFTMVEPGMGADTVGRVVTPRIEAVWAELRSYDGAILWRQRDSSHDSPLQNRVAATLGDTLFLVSNTAGPFPTIMEFVLSPAGARPR